MAISLKTAGTWARMVTDNGTVAIPGTPAAGDRMFLFGSWKTYTVTVADPSGWNLIDDFSDGTSAAGNGSGSVHNAVWYRDWQSGDAAPAIDYSAAPTEGHWVIQLWTKAGGDTWGTPAAVHAAIASADPFTATSSATVTVPDSSVVMCLIGLADDSTTIARTTTAITDDGSPALTWNGNYVESPATHFTSTTGLDMSGDLGHRFVTTGAAGVNLVTTGDPAAAETGTATWIVQGLAVNPSGTGAITVPSGTVSGTGAETFTATGAVSVPSGTVVGTGTEVFTATGSVTVPAGTVAGSGDHDLSAPSGTGDITVPAATVEGSGTHTPNPSGTGAITGSAPAVSGTGALVLTATGAISLPPVTVDGTGAETFTATGSITGQAPTVVADGVVITPVTGTGAISVPSVTVAGDGLHTENATGSGSIQIPAPTVVGVGAETLTATGAISGQPPVVVGSGEHAEAIPVTGTGAIVVPAGRVAGVGSGGDTFGATITIRPSVTGELVSTASTSGAISEAPALTGVIE